MHGFLHKYLTSQTIGKVLNLVNTTDKLTNMRVGFGRVEANYIATNPMIFDELKIGDMPVCIEKDDYFGMREGIRELVTQIDDLFSLIIDLFTIIIELYNVNPELRTDLKILQLINLLNRLRKVK